MSVTSPSHDAAVTLPMLASNGAVPCPPTIVPARARRLTPDAFFHLTMLGLALVFLLGSVIGLYLTQTIVPPGQVLARLPLLVVLLAGMAFYRWRRIPRAVNLIAMTTWAYVFGNLYIVPMFIAARRQTPMSDALLARLDAALGVEVPAVLQGMAAYPALGPVLDFCYNLLLILVTLAIMIPPICNKMQAAKEYAVGGVLAALICLPLFAMFQAVGPWVIYGYAPAPDQEHYMRTFAALKAEEWYTLDLAYREGLICFPSFHTILAVLAAAALWRIRYVRWPAALLAALIVVSTVTTGWHYVVDVVAGLLVAVVVRALAMAYSRLEARWTRPVGEPSGKVPS
jgi:membrane-associated phospholipid phosphatase